MAEGGHTYEFGPPAGGWPDFDADGKRIRDDMIATLEAAALDNDIARCSHPAAPPCEA